jgi:hypothetical protein
MILFLPRRLITTQKRQQAATMQFSACGLDEESAAAARSDDQVDLLD